MLFDTFFQIYFILHFLPYLFSPPIITPLLEPARQGQGEVTVGLVWFLPQVPVQTRSSLWGTCVGKVWVLETGASISFHLPGTARSSSTRPT